MRKTYFFITLGIGTVFFSVQTVFAAPLLIKQEIRKEIRDERQDAIQTMGGTQSGIKAKIRTRAALLKAQVTGKGTDTITVKSEDGKEYTVRFDASTQWRRKFWGKSDFAETNVNDVLNIHGKWNNEEMTEIQARLIRNISIQKRNGVFFGTVKSLTSSGWLMTTVIRGDQTVTVSGNTQLVDRKQTGIPQSAVLVGHRVRVKGLWDSKNSTITEVTQVKDFDLPAKATPTPKP